LSTHLRTWRAEPTDDWSSLLAVAEAADEAGIDRLVVSDHVIMGERLHEYARPEVGGQAGGRQPTGSDGPWLEPLTVLATVAARTGRVRLQTGVLLASLRRPVVLAKTVATIQALSGGRLDLGVGVGWQREEYDAAGLPFAGRGALLDHTLAVCEALWRGETAFADDRLRYEGVHLSPRPGRVPVWVSGRPHAAVLARVARFGSGWIPWGPEAALDALPGALATVHAALRDAGRDLAGFDVTATLPLRTGATGHVDLEATLAPAGPLGEIGVTDVRVNLPMSDDAGRDEALDAFGRLVDAHRATVGEPDERGEPDEPGGPAAPRP
jgi:probable F420-dependent oxidoreductase